MKLDKDKFHEDDADYARQMMEKVAWDDLTGMKLDAGKVIEARGREMEYVDRKKVWVKVPRHVAISRGWKIIQT